MNKLFANKIRAEKLGNVSFSFDNYLDEENQHHLELSEQYLDSELEPDSTTGLGSNRAISPLP